MKFFKTIFFLTPAFLFQLAFPQQFNFHNYSVKEGVAQSQVYSLLQDSRGYLWMGTRGGGITRFDGTEFKTLTIKDGLVNNYVFCIREDEQGNLWIGTNNGLSTYNGISFSGFLSSSDTSELWVKEIEFDTKGRKWLATNDGVLLIDGKETVNVTGKLGAQKTVVNALHVDKKGTVWFGTGYGLYRITEKNGIYSLQKYEKVFGKVNNSVTAIREDQEGIIWIGTYGDGAYLYDSKKFYRIDNNLELYKQTIQDIYFDHSGQVWMATLNSGVCEYNRKSGSFAWLTESEGLGNNHVRSIIQDKSGNYWFGTSGGGVCNYFGKQFTQYDKNSGMGGNYIYSIFKDSKGRLWTGTSDKGVTKFDSSHFTNYHTGSGFADFKVKAIGEDSEGNIYLGTDGQGIYIYDGFEFRELEALKKKYIRSMVSDKDGNLWIATAGAGLYKLIPGSRHPKLLHFTKEDGLLHDRLTCLSYDKQGRTWYGTENNGIGFVVNDKAQRMSIGQREGLPSNSIRCLSEDQSGYLWIGTGGSGIASIPLYQGDFPVKTYDHTNGLASSNIYLVTADNLDNIFVGTETGLDYLVLNKERKPVEIKHYSKGEGFTGIETCQNSVFAEKDGTIWFGTINGLSKYNPANQVKNVNEPVTTITDVKLNYVTLAQTNYKQFTGDWNRITYMELPYDQNNLSFDFLAINFSNPYAVRYQWKMEGFDKDWSPVSKQHTINYSNLNAGNYTFLVKACNEDGVWNHEPVKLKFHISPPLWLRWWFIALILSLLFLLVFLVFRWRIRIIQKRANELQDKLKMEKEIVELEQKALRLQMNPHFIFNALNSIQSQIGTDNEQSARYYLAKFSRLMRQILDNSRNTSITLEEEVNTLENYLLIEKFCNGDRFDYRITLDPVIEKDYIKIPPMLLQPFVENAIKHGLKYVEGKRGLIEVEFKERTGILECSITDNGIGRKKAEEMRMVSKETYHRSTALLVTEERLSKMGVEGNAVPLEIIDLFDGSGEAMGTRVIVRIPVG